MNVNKIDTEPVVEVLLHAISLAVLSWEVLISVITDIGNVTSDLVKQIISGIPSERSVFIDIGGCRWSVYVNLSTEGLDIDVPAIGKMKGVWLMKDGIRFLVPDPETLSCIERLFALSTGFLSNIIDNAPEDSEVTVTFGDYTFTYGCDSLAIFC